MNKNNMIDLLEKIEQTGLSDLKTELDEEMNKPSDERDLIKIRDLIDSISEIEGDDSDGAFRRQKAQIKERVKADRSVRITRRRKQLVALAACAALLFGLNQASLNAYGENVFKRAYHFTKGGVSIMIGENDDTEPTEPPTAPPATDVSVPEEVMELPTYPGDPYGIKAVCANYELYPLTPSFIPDGFKLVNLIQSDDSYTTDIQLTYQCREQRIIIGYIYCKSDAGSVGIPADTGIQYEINVNSIPFAIIKEDGQYKALCLNDKLFYTIQTYGIEYDEAEKIVNSMN